MLESHSTVQSTRGHWCLPALVLGLFALPAFGAVHTVTKTDDTDDGVCDIDCSVREAVNVSLDGDTVVIPAGIYALQLGELEIVVDMTVIGDGSEATFLEADESVSSDVNRVATIGQQKLVKLRDLTLRNASVQGFGGALENSGRLSLLRVVIEDSFAWIAGGLYNQPTGEVLLRDVVIRNCEGLQGGAIGNDGLLRAIGVVLDGNTAGFAAGLMNEANGRATLIDSVVSNNFSSGLFVEGGAIRNVGSASLLRTQIVGNTALGSFATGGGIDNFGTLKIRDSQITGNRAEDLGGGIRNQGSLRILGSTVADNIAEGLQGGGIVNFGPGDLLIGNSTLSGNVVGGDGGGLFNTDSATLFNVTLSGNLAVNGGGIANVGSLTMTNLTLADNAATAEGGGVKSTGGGASMVNTISAGNTAPEGPNCDGGITSGGHNLIGNLIGCGLDPIAGDQVGTPTAPIDPLLGLLADNGGSTLTHSLLEASPAIDAADDAEAPLLDQRGVSRPQGAAADIGAYEREE